MSAPAGRFADSLPSVSRRPASTPAPAPLSRRRLALRQVQRIYMTLFQVVAIEGVLLAIACGVTLLYIWLLKPYVRATRDEVQRCARMLAMLPSAMDVEGMVTEMLDIHSTELTYQSTASAGMRVYTFCAEGVARCLLGRRFKNLIDMERSTLQQRAAQEKARRTKLEQEMKGGVGGKKG